MATEMYWHRRLRCLGLNLQLQIEVDQRGPMAVRYREIQALQTTPPGGNGPLDRGQLVPDASASEQDPPAGIEAGEIHHRQPGIGLRRNRVA